MRGVARGTLLAATSLALAACAGGSGDMTPTEARNEIVARTFVDAWAAEDEATLTGLFDPNAIYDDYADQAQYRGLAEILPYLTSSQDWATGVNIDIGAVHTSEHGVTIEWTFSGIQDKPLGARIPVVTGNDVVLNGVTILEIDKGLIHHASEYVDELPLLLQLGAEVRLPGGGTIKLDDVLPPPADTSGGGES